MNSILALGTLGAFTAAALAGPGPQFWARPASTPAPAKAVTSEAPAGGCGACKITPAWEFVSSLPNGKGTPRWTVVGSRHDCGGCGGAVTTLRGQTRDTMDRANSACAKTGMSCCR